MNQKLSAHHLDLAVLKPQSSREDVLAGCRQALELEVKSFIVLPMWLDLCVERLKGSGVRPSVVIGFPFGAETTECKVLSARECVEAGAVELDMVLPIGKLKSGDEDAVFDDIQWVVSAAKAESSNALVKVILETCWLTHDEKVCAARLCEKAGADFVKTSTGFGSAGATVEDVRLLRETVGAQVQIKASGGIRSRSQAQALLDAGASRIGTSNAFELLQS